MPPTSLLIQRRNAVRRRRRPVASPPQQQQRQQQQRQQATAVAGPQTLTRPFSFDGREAITTQSSASTTKNHPRPQKSSEPLQDTTPVCSPPDRGQISPVAPEHPDPHSSSFNDDSWTSAYSDSGLTGNDTSNYQLGGAERQSRSMTLSYRQVRASTLRDLIPSNPFAEDDDDDDEKEGAEPQRAAAATTRAVTGVVQDAAKFGDLKGDGRWSGASSGPSSKQLDKLGSEPGVSKDVVSPVPGAPRARQARAGIRSGSVVSDVSESSGRRSVSPIGAKDGGNLKSKKRKGFAWLGKF